ncbi:MULTISPECIES: hypothetical protein [unclassified Amycolatopsis]|uniref:hypothetical protein n=1 Tax=unclassified Amycolatopsis TaxID=2618356 RepID=UPI0028740B8E|nr:MULTISPECIES: hypothetical protein [unclassified Amycolatopsis]MDS0135765.1 hypothetical protein [Amycolatopsis sp. 505]MDS0145634.1 hypothetical protein [Amycolatopsis sp. CM201R]
MGRTGESSDQGRNDKLDSEEFYSRFPHKQTHPPIGKFRRYPRISKSSTEDLMSALNQVWYPDAYGHEFARYKLMRAVAAPCYFFLIGYLLVLQEGFSLTQKLDLIEKILLSLMAAVIVRGVWLSRVGGSKRRFFRAIGVALRSLEVGAEQATRNKGNLGWLRFKPLHEGSLVEALNFTGVAARGLFTSLQRSRWTWQSPPMVAERAVRLSSPLIDVEIVDDLDITLSGVDPIKWLLLYGFLYDVAAVVAIRREDLIPAVRSLYSELPARRESGNESKARDLRYLDPMHERSRWEVVKDYVLPLSSWLSLSVSVVALVIAINK